MRRPLYMLAAVSAIACFTPSLFAQRGNITRSVRGDTIVVTNKAPGSWGPARDAVEILRVGGESDETTFGQVYSLSATPDGGVIVYDTKGLNGPIVRQFDASGRFVRNIGRQGRGPGEYDQPFTTWMGVSHGTLLLRDGMRVVNRYSTADGRFLSGIALNHNNGSTNEVYGGPDGSVYVRAAFPRGMGTGPIGQQPLVRYDTAGNKLDSIFDQKRWVAGELPMTSQSVRDWWSVLPNGRVLYTRTDLVGFLIVDPRGEGPPFIASVDATPVKFAPEERKELEEIDAWSRANMPARAPRPPLVVPEFKQLSGGASVDVSGRIWIQRPGPGVKGTPRVAASFGGRNGSGQIMKTFEDTYSFAAFEQNGTYLGELRFPRGARPTFIGDFAWAMVQGQDDEQFLVKFRLR